MIDGTKRDISKSLAGIDQLKAIPWLYHFLIGPRREKTCLRGFANNKGADQPAHPRSLISAFVVRFLKNVICKLATGEISS